MYMDFVQVNNDIFLVVEDNAMHYLDDAQSVYIKIFQNLFNKELKCRFFTGGIGRKNLLTFVAPGGPKYSDGKAV